MNASNSGTCQSILLLKLALTRIERKVEGPSAQLSKTSTFSSRVSSMRNRHLTGLTNGSNINCTHKTPVSTSTGRSLQDAGILGRMVKKRAHLRLANKRQRLRWTKEHKDWIEEDRTKPYGETHLILRCFDHTCDITKKIKRCWSA